MNTLESIDFRNRTALVRLDFNVPLDDQGRITNDRRIREALPTLQYILANGGSLVCLSHLGRPDGPDPALSLRPVQARLGELLGRPVQFVADPLSPEADAVYSHLKPGDVVLVENTRFWKAEKKADPDFAKQLSRLGQVFVMDAFGTAHRAEASTATVAGYFAEKCGGRLLQAEVQNAQRVLDSAQRPYVLVTGGAKVSDKIGILENLLPHVDAVIIGGGMAYTFIKAQGGEIGKSLCEDDRLDLARDLLARAAAQGKRILLPVDSVVADQFSATANTQTVDSNAIPAGWMGLDIGPQALAEARELVMGAKTILWNGPMGVFELESFSRGTFGIAQAVADATALGAYSLIGGGDSAAAIEQAGLASQVSYVSTGGGALLKYLEGKTLPGIAALQ
jgi:phosphoglycerate kinase